MQIIAADGFAASVHANTAIGGNQITVTLLGSKPPPILLPGQAFAVLLSPNLLGLPDLSNTERRWCYSWTLAGGVYTLNCDYFTTTHALGDAVLGTWDASSINGSAASQNSPDMSRWLAQLGAQAGGYATGPAIMVRLHDSFGSDGADAWAPFDVEMCRKYNKSLRARGVCHINGALGFTLSVGTTIASPTITGLARYGGVVQGQGISDAAGVIPNGTTVSTYPLAGNSSATAAITSGTNTLTVTGGDFSPTCAGCPITVTGAGPGGADLVTTIGSYVSANSVHLATNAGTTVASANYSWTDYTRATLSANATNTGTNPVSFCYGAPGAWQTVEGLTLNTRGIAGYGQQMGVGQTCTSNEILADGVRFHWLSDTGTQLTLQVDGSPVKVINNPSTNGYYDYAFPTGLGIHTVGYSNTGTGTVSVDSPYLYLNNGLKGGSSGVTGSGNTSFTDANANFPLGAKGNSITIRGAGVSGADLVTTIAAVVSPTQVTLAAAPSTTLGSATYVYATSGVQIWDVSHSGALTKSYHDYTDIESYFAEIQPHAVMLCTMTNDGDFGGSVWPAGPVLTETNGSVTNGSPILTLSSLTSFAGMVGYAIIGVGSGSGGGVPAGAAIKSVSGQNLTMWNGISGTLNATATLSGQRYVIGPSSYALWATAVLNIVLDNTTVDPSLAIFSGYQGALWSSLGIPCGNYQTMAWDLAQTYDAALLDLYPVVGNVTTGSTGVQDNAGWTRDGTHPSMQTSVQLILPDMLGIFDPSSARVPQQTRLVVIVGGTTYQITGYEDEIIFTNASANTLNVPQPNDLMYPTAPVIPGGTGLGTGTATSPVLAPPIALGKEIKVVQGRSAGNVSFSATTGAFWEPASGATGLTGTGQSLKLTATDAGHWLLAA